MSEPQRIEYRVQVRHATGRNENLGVWNRSGTLPGSRRDAYRIFRQTVDAVNRRALDATVHIQMREIPAWTDDTSKAAHFKREET